MQKRIIDHIKACFILLALIISIKHIKVTIIKTIKSTIAKNKPV